MGIVPFKNASFFFGTESHLHGSKPGGLIVTGERWRYQNSRGSVKMREVIWVDREIRVFNRRGMRVGRRWRRGRWGGRVLVGHDREARRAGPRRT